jgi:hypothetical protein
MFLALLPVSNERSREMKSENKWMGLKAGIVSAVAIFTFMTGVGASTAHAKVFHAWVEGLPSGVLVQFVGQWSCFIDNHNPMLTETQVTRYEVAPNPFGHGAPTGHPYGVRRTGR